MTTQLKETDPSEFTQHTMTEEEVLATPEFTETRNVLENRLLKPGECIKLTLPHDQWSVESLRTLQGCLVPSFQGCGYTAEAFTDDDSEYIIFKNTRVEDDSEFIPPDLSAKELKGLASPEFDACSDSELQGDYRFYGQTAAKLSLLPNNDLAQLRRQQCVAMTEAILTVAYRRGLPWAVEEMHKTAAVGQA
jgi:hypothetical protein